MSRLGHAFIFFIWIHFGFHVSSPLLIDFSMVQVTLSVWRNKRDALRYVNTKLGVRKVLAFDFHQVQIFMQPIQQVGKKLLNFTGEWLHETGKRMQKKHVRHRAFHCAFMCLLFVSFAQVQGPGWWSEFCGTKSLNLSRSTLEVSWASCWSASRNKCLANLAIKCNKQVDNTDQTGFQRWHCHKYRSTRAKG